ncbi:GNAT family N-acetyltransferase [Marivirga sp. S37H4]|uniref:GNAT family N-acetyltransferase n=1 Tax=Marivirga aurantiaca TaxID=2802615 RepID=A0A934WZH1_9BACT|nr:GNAT family N-acetyltransferase [Marivirga aurantiaca]MBK6266073.1 GNAT family N-acetyltransferase [Marivirga aurantiaca]
MDNFTIRFVKQGDLIPLIDLCEAHAEYEKASFDKFGKAEKLGQYLFGDTPALYCLVVEKDHQLIGYATYIKQFSTWDASFYIYMDCLFMNDTSRGMGLGEKLVDKIKEEAKKLGCDLIQWQTPDFNTRAIKFYKRIGAVSKPKERFFLTVE